MKAYVEADKLGTVANGKAHFGADFEEEEGGGAEVARR